MPAEEDLYLPPGRRWIDREELCPPEDEIELGPPTLDNDTLYRQQFAIHDYVKTLRQQIAIYDVNSKTSPHMAIKPAIKSSFYIQEQRQADQDFVEPDDEVNKQRQAGEYIIDYMKYYKNNPIFVEQLDETTKALKQHLNEKMPIPSAARTKIAMMRKIEQILVKSKKNPKKAIKW